MMAESISTELAQKIVTISEFKKELVERTKNYGVKSTPTGVVHSLKLSFEGSIGNVIRSKGKDKWGAEEAARLYNIGREAWIKGDFETVADLFGVLV